MLILPFRPGAGDLGFPLLCEKFHERNQKKENPVATHLHEVLEPSLSGGLPSSVDRKKPGKMGLSSAFSITEGENAWEKLKIVVSDLFLGGVEEKISRHISKQQNQENGEQDDEVVETTNNQPTSSGLLSDVPENNSSLPAARSIIKEVVVQHS